MHNTLEIGICVFFYLIEQPSQFLLHTVQVLYMCTVCGSTDIITLHNVMIFGFPAQNVNESVDKTRQHNLGHLHTGMVGPLPATTSVGKQPSCAITLRRPKGFWVRREVG